MAILKKMMELNTYGFAVVILQLTTAFNIRCPEVSERFLRSKARCSNAHKYTCLYDENKHSYSESCSVKFDFQRPGYRVTLRTNLHAETCLGNLYQPFIFYTNKSSNCELEKSVCRGEGQIVSTNGTILTDRQCRCNYAHGYTYVTKPKNICSCAPSVEDCSCFRKRCSNHSHILSPDYLCIDKVRWSGKFRCSSIQELRATTMTISRERQKTEERQRTLIRKHQPIKIAILVTLVWLLICSTFTIWKEDAEYAAIEKNNDNKASMHDKEKIQDFDQELKIQSNVNEESKRIPEYKEHAAIDQKDDNKSSLHVNEKTTQDVDQEPKIQGNVDVETLRIPELCEHATIELKIDINSTLHDEEKIPDFEQEPKLQEKVDEENQRISELDENAAIAPKDENNSILHDKEQIQDFGQEPKIQKNVDEETQRIPELDEHASIELKNDINSTLHDEEQIPDFEQEPKLQEKVDEENQRISELDENAAIAPKDENNSTLHDKEQTQDFGQEPKIQKNVDDETKRIPELDEHASIELKNDINSTLHDEEQIPDFEQEPKLQEKVDEENQRISELDENAAIAPKDENNSTMHDKEQTQDFGQEPKIQKNVDDETQRIPELDELASIEPKDGNSSTIHDREKMKDFEKEPKIQKNVEEENQRISELDEDISRDTKEWENDIEPIAEKDFIEFINKTVENIVSNNYIFLHGEPDCGKSPLLRKIVLQLENRLECIFLPCTDPSEIVNQHCEKASKAFVIHDIFGKFVFSFEQLVKWKDDKLKQQLKDGKVKLLMTSSSAMFMTKTVQTLSFFKDNAFELPASNLSASTDTNKTLTDLTGWVKELRYSNPSVFYSLFFCILNKGYIDIAFLTAEGGNLFTAFSDDVLNSFNITISQDAFLNDLHFLMKSFITKENDTFSIQQSSIFNGLVGYFGQELQQPFIKHADPDIITHHCCLTSCPASKVIEMFGIQVNSENEEIYFKRIIDELRLCNFSKVLSIRQMKSASYQMKLVYFLKKLPKEAFNQLCSFKCRFEDETMLQLASDKRCIKLATFLRDELCNISMPDQSGHQHQLQIM